jgi:hypothetical protein
MSRVVRAATAAGALLLVLAGCQRTPRTAPAPMPTRLPVEYAGGACQLLTYGAVDQALGVHFDVAASDKSGDSFSCVLQTEAEDYPDLALVVSPSTADSKTFAKVVQPTGATAVKSLGKVGYRATMKGSNGGQAVEVGWLTGNGRLLVLRVTMPVGRPLGDMPDRVVALAKVIDRSSL